MNKLIEYLGAKNIAARKTARSALYNFLKCAAELAGKKKVLVPSFCCQSVYLAIELAGCEAELIDVDLTNFSILYSATEDKLCDDTLAVIFPHMFGICAINNLDKWQFLRDKFPEVVWVEDACQTSLQKSEHNINLGGHLDVGLFSCDNTKPIQGAMGLIAQYKSSKLLDAVFNVIDNYSGINIVEYRIAEFKRLESSIFSSIISKKRLRFDFVYNLEIIEDLRELYSDNSPPANFIYRKSYNFFVDALCCANHPLNNYYFDILYVELSKLENMHFDLYDRGPSDVIWRYPIIFKRIDDALNISSLLRNKGVNCSNHYFDLESIFRKESKSCVNSVYISHRIINVWFNSDVELRTCIDEIQKYYIK